MKKIHIVGWLVMAAAFITTFTACSSDDAIEEPKAPVRSISVSVGAGINDVATTRSGIDNSVAGKRTLKFTEGDKLFVRAMYGYADGLYYEYMLRGYLTMVGSPTNDGMSASFSGELTQYNRGTENSTDGYEYTPAGSITVYNGSDPLGNDYVKEVYATLVHSSATIGTDYTDNGWDIFYATNYLTPDVNTLMTKYLAVTSSSEGTGYDSSNKSFTLNDAGNTPILNCTISGLTANTTYTVTYNIEGGDVDLSPTVTADESGKATFAFFGDESSSSHALTFVSTSPDETKTANLGNKDLGVSFRIFNVSRTATAN